MWTEFDEKDYYFDSVSPTIHRYKDNSWTVQGFTDQSIRGRTHSWENTCLDKFYIEAWTTKSDISQTEITLWGDTTYNKVLAFPICTVWVYLILFLQVEYALQYPHGSWNRSNTGYN